MADVVRDRGTQGELLSQIVDRLQQQIAELHGGNCFLSDAPVPAMFPQATPICTVTPGPGRFPPEFFAGGGHQTVTEYATVQVSLFTRVKLDRPVELRAAMLEKERGILTRLKPAVLRALLVDQQPDGSFLAWEPRSNSVAILRNQLYPQSCTAPGIVSSDDDFLGMTLTFGTDFDWTL